MWVKSIHTSREEQRQQHYADSATLRQQHEAALRIKQEELDRLIADYELLKEECLNPQQKPKGFMHTPIGQIPAKPKTGWFNKTLALLVAFHSGETEIVEQLVAECLIS